MIRCLLLLALPLLAADSPRLQLNRIGATLALGQFYGELTAADANTRFSQHARQLTDPAPWTQALLRLSERLLADAATAIQRIPNAFDRESAERRLAWLTPSLRSARDTGGDVFEPLAELAALAGRPSPELFANFRASAKRLLPVAFSPPAAQALPDITGEWSGYFTNNPSVRYPQRIAVVNGQLTLTAALAPNSTTNNWSSIATVDPSGRITAPQFNATGQISADGNRIDWNNGSVWLRATSPAPSNTNLALGKPTSTSSRSIYSTPSESGGVDGIKNGGFGFHTNEERDPWWTVDLQQTANLSEIRVFNRADGNGVRARTLRALVSLDGSNWRQVYDQGGRVFGTDGVPLRIPLNNVPARWVRLQLNDTTYLHLDEVEVYGAGTAPATGPGPAPTPSGPAPELLGRVWREQEGAFSGIWTRRGDSNVFDASWSGGAITGVLTFTLTGNQVSIVRRGSDNCRYTGTINGRNVSGLFDSCSGGALSAPWSAVIDGPSPASPPPASGSFLAADSSSQGNWRGRFGADGALLAAEPAGIPFRYATVTPAGATLYSWGATADPRGLARLNSPDRWAAAWYSPTAFEIAVNPSGNLPARLSAYFIDWDNNGRAQRIDLIDAASNAVLDSRSLSSFTAGQYLSWRIASAVKLRVTRTAGPNAVLSALFLDSGASATPPPSAAFLGADTSTLGNWVGRYGSAGAVIPTDGATPSAFTVTPVSKFDYSWGSTQETRAPSRISQPGRIAAAWYAEGSFEVAVAPPSAQPYRLSAYFLDWDATGRSQRVELLDAATGTVLDTQTVSNFRNGQYLSWNVSTTVRLRLTRLAGPNVTLAGLFVDAGGPQTPIQPPVQPPVQRPVFPPAPPPVEFSCANPRTLPLMDQWLASARPIPRPGDQLRYEPWGRLVGRTATAIIQTPAPPETPLSRCEWLWQHSPNMNSQNLGTLRDFLVRGLR